MAASYRLGLLGVRSHILEAGPELGGLGVACQIGGQPVERFFHFIKGEDKHMLQILKDFGLEDRLRWSRTQMGFYMRKKIFSLSGPLDLLRFRPFNWRDKIRFVSGMLRTQNSNSEELNGISARDWVLSQWTENIYSRMMEPLLQNKFALKGDRVSAAFFHNRIKAMLKTKSKMRGGDKLGYLHGSAQVLRDRLEQETRKTAEVSLNTRIQGVEQTDGGFAIETDRGSYKAKYIVNTLPLTVFESIKKNFAFQKGVDYQGALCGIFLIKNPVTGFFWLNVLDDDILFKVVVNQSILDDYPGTVIYCANYVHPESPLFHKGKEEIMDGYLRGLEKMFGKIEVLESKFSKTAYATPVFDIDYGKKTADLDRCVPGMYFAGNAKIYPFNRVISNILATGFQAAERIARDLGIKGREAAEKDIARFACA